MNRPSSEQQKGSRMGESKYQSHREIRVYRVSFELALEVFKLSEVWPNRERFGLIDQIRRSSRSVCSNIAEAWRKRSYRKHFMSKLSDAQYECAETETWIEIAHSCGYICLEESERLMDQTDHIAAMLTKMIRSPEKWCK